MTEFKNARSGVLVGVILSGFGSVAFGVVMLLGAIDSVMKFESAGRLEIASPSFIFAAAGFVPFLVFGWSAVSSWRQLRSWQRINDQGIIAWGTLGEPRFTNERLNSRNIYRIPLSVIPPHGAPYSVESKWFFPPDFRGHARPGMRVVVRIDPQDAGTVLVDWDRTRTSWGMPPWSDE